MNKNIQTLILIIIVVLVLIPTGAMAKNYVLDNYVLLESEGVVASSVATMWEDSLKSKVIVPTPISKDCPCKGTRKEKTGDGISTVPCRCGQNCPCSSGQAPKTTPPTQVTLLVAGARSCRFCVLMHNSTEPALLANGWTFGKGKNIEILDVDLDPNLARQYSITSLPTTLRLENGKVTHTYQGYINAGGFGKVWNGLPLTEGDRVYVDYSQKTKRR